MGALLPNRVRPVSDLSQAQPALVSRSEALDVKRPKSLAEPWVWPDPVQVMVSDTYKFGLSGKSYGDDPLAHAIALEMLRLLYDHGYALVRTEAVAR